MSAADRESARRKLESEMLVWDEEELSPPLPNYIIIRRHGHVVPFEPSAIEEAMAKAFWAVCRSIDRAARSVVELLIEATRFQWKCLPASGLGGVLRLQFNHGIQARRLTPRKGCVPGVSRGFFSAVKPDLRNAP